MRRISFLGTAAACVLGGRPALADTLAQGLAANTFELREVASNLSQPTSVDWLPDGRMLVTEKTGNVVLVDGAGTEGGTQKVIGTFPVNTVSEQGLLHVLVHPDFAANRRLIFYYSAAASAGGTDLDRQRVVTVPLGEDDQLDRSKEVVLIRGLRGPQNHDGGALAIGPDGKLYVGVGDTGCNSGKSPEPLYTPTNYFGTCLTNGNGKILRINLDGTIPDDNPLVGKQVTACGNTCGVAPTALDAAREDIWAWGFRNPWRFWFDPKTGNLWVGDVGEVTYEELDVIPQTGGGKHYGWPWREGGKGAEPDKCADITPNAGDCVDPQYYCLHNGKSPLTDAGQLDNDCGSITGGVIVDSCQFPAAYRGKYFFADAGTNWVATLNTKPDRSGVFTTSKEKLISVGGQPVDVAVGPDGALYYAVIGSNGSGNVQRLFPKTPEVCPMTPEPGGPADAGVDASEPSTGGQASTGGSAGSGNTGGQSSGGASGEGARDGGGSGTGSSEDDGCDCRVGRSAERSTAKLAALIGALALISRRRRARAR